MWDTKLGWCDFETTRQKLTPTDNYPQLINSGYGQLFQIQMYSLINVSAP